MQWKELFIALVVAAGAYLGAEAFGASRGTHKKKLKLAGVALALGAGLCLVAGMWQFGWVRNPPWMVAALAASALLFQGARALKDMLDGDPDRQARIAVLMLPLILVLGLGWLKTNAFDMGKQGVDHVQNSTVR